MAYLRNNEFIKRVGKRIKQIRKREGITQSQLSFESGIRINQIGRIERGEVNTSITNIVHIAKALNVEPFELLQI
jgi:transcriptional regulator with XRE-family HTH domain